MPKSKTRGTRKQHRVRVIARNATLRGERRKLEEKYQKMMQESYEKFMVENPQLSGNTENIDTSENVNISLDEKDRGLTITNVDEEKAANIEVDYIPVTQDITDEEK
jgi:hypothetical protein